MSSKAFREKMTEMKSKFQIGTLVRLKSGGPKMVVERVGEGNTFDEVICLWFPLIDSFEKESYQENGTEEPVWGDPQRSQFHQDTLDKVQGEEYA